MIIKGIEFHFNNGAIAKYPITSVERDMLFHYTLNNKQYYYNCQDRKVYKKVLCFWIWQKQYNIKYNVFLTNSPEVN